MDEHGRNEIKNFLRRKFSFFLFFGLKKSVMRGFEDNAAVLENLIFFFFLALQCIHFQRTCFQHIDDPEKGGVIYLKPLKMQLVQVLFFI